MFCVDICRTRSGDPFSRYKYLFYFMFRRWVKITRSKTNLSIFKLSSFTSFLTDAGRRFKMRSTSSGSFNVNPEDLPFIEPKMMSSKRRSTDMKTWETRLESTWSSKKGLNLNVERSWSLELIKFVCKKGLQKMCKIFASEFGSKLGVMWGGEMTIQ